MKVFERVAEILKDLSGLNEIKPEDHLQQDLALDSMLMVTLLIELEDEFDIELDEADMNPFDLNTVQDTVDLVNKYGGDQDE